MTLKVTSSAFESGQGIPVRFTCEGVDSSPPLQWAGVPADAKSLALICDDPDAPVGTWVHWVLYDLPAATVELNEKVPTSETLPNGAKQGVNDFKRVGVPLSSEPKRTPKPVRANLSALERRTGIAAVVASLVGRGAGASA